MAYSQNPKINQQYDCWEDEIKSNWDGNDAGEQETALGVS